MEHNSNNNNNSTSKPGPTARISAIFRPLSTQAYSALTTTTKSTMATSNNTNTNSTHPQDYFMDTSSETAFPPLSSSIAATRSTSSRKFKSNVTNKPITLSSLVRQQQQQQQQQHSSSSSSSTHQNTPSAPHIAHNNNINSINNIHKDDLGDDDSFTPDILSGYPILMHSSEPESNLSSFNLQQNQKNQRAIYRSQHDGLANAFNLSRLLDNDQPHSLHVDNNVDNNVDNPTSISTSNKNHHPTNLDIKIPDSIDNHQQNPNQYLSFNNDNDNNTDTNTNTNTNPNGIHQQFRDHKLYEYHPQIVGDQDEHEDDDDGEENITPTAVGADVTTATTATVDHNFEEANNHEDVDDLIDDDDEDEDDDKLVDDEELAKINRSLTQLSHQTHPNQQHYSNHYQNSLSQQYSSQVVEDGEEQEEEEEQEQDVDHRIDGIYNELDDIGDWVASITPKAGTDLTKQLNKISNSNVNQASSSRSLNSIATNSQSHLSTTSIATTALNSQQRQEDKRRDNLARDKVDRATVEQVLDPRTRMILFRLLSRHRLRTLDGCVSTGKEANVYYATAASIPDARCDNNGIFPPIPGLIANDITPDTPVAVKVFKTSILQFKDRERYVHGEFRFRRPGYQRSSNRKMVQQWAEKEFRNQNRLLEANVPAPIPLLLKAPVLIMSFFGKDGWPAPRLKDAALSIKKLTKSYFQVCLLMRRMFQVAKLVHGDLSEYNMLYWNNSIVIIDVSQSVEDDHPMALDFLRRDCANVNDFFRRTGVMAVLSVRELFDFVTSPFNNLHHERHEDETELAANLNMLLNRAGNRNIDENRNVQQDDDVFMRSYVPRTLQEIEIREAHFRQQQQQQQQSQNEQVNDVAPAAFVESNLFSRFTGLSLSQRKDRLSGSTNSSNTHHPNHSSNIGNTSSSVINDRNSSMFLGAANSEQESSLTGAYDDPVVPEINMNNTFGTDGEGNGEVNLESPFPEPPTFRLKDGNSGASDSSTGGNKVGNRGGMSSTNDGKLINVRTSQRVQQKQTLGMNSSASTSTNNSRSNTKELRGTRTAESGSGSGSVGRNGVWEEEDDEFQDAEELIVDDEVGQSKQRNILSEKQKESNGRTVQFEEEYENGYDGSNGTVNANGKTMARRGLDESEDSDDDEEYDDEHEDEYGAEYGDEEGDSELSREEWKRLKKEEQEKAAAEARLGLSKKDWKKKIKEENRERRENKVPKHVKRRKETLAKKRRGTK